MNPKSNDRPKKILGENSYVRNGDDYPDDIYPEFNDMTKNFWEYLFCSVCHQEKKISSGCFIAISSKNDRCADCNQQYEVKK